MALIKPMIIYLDIASPTGAVGASLIALGSKTGSCTKFLFEVHMFMLSKPSHFSPPPQEVM